MRLYTVEHVHTHRLDRAMSELLNRVISSLGDIKMDLEDLMVDTSKLLAEVARQKTDNDGLRALVEANTSALQTISAQLADAISKLAAQGTNTVDLVALQKDIDQATTDLSLDSDKTEAALKANNPNTGQIGASQPGSTPGSVPADTSGGAATPLPGTAGDPSATPPAATAPADTTPPTTPAQPS